VYWADFPKSKKAKKQYDTNPLIAHERNKSFTHNNYHLHFEIPHHRQHYPTSRQNQMQVDRRDHLKTLQTNNTAAITAMKKLASSNVIPCY
jgi:hypothetical protein